MGQTARVIERPGLVWTAGAPEPVVIANEIRTSFAFFTPSDLAQVAEFVGYVAVRFGFPNDEVLHGHPLWGHGLQFYATHEVAHSTWLEELRAIEQVHDRAPSNPFAEATHFVLTFHDSTLEAIAQDIVVRDQFDTMELAVLAIASTVT